MESRIHFGTAAHRILLGAYMKNSGMLLCRQALPRQFPSNSRLPTRYGWSSAQPRCRLEHASRPWLNGCLLAVALIGAHQARAEDRTWEYSVQVSATAQTTPPSLQLSWPQDVNGEPISYTVSRKNKDATAWETGLVLPGSVTTYADTNVELGQAYEYQIHKLTADYSGFGYIYAGIQAPMVERRGRLILIVDDTVATPLSSELERLARDLIGDGWTVSRHDVPRNATPPQVKGVIQSEYVADPANTRCVFLFGRIPVPYSGDMAPDDHTEDLGAWPADLYYGDMDGVWTDETVNDISGQTSRRWNVPGDGKFDQTAIPSAVELEVGRVDLANMPGRKEWMGPPTFPDEIELLRNYLHKDHAFRHATFKAAARGLVYDGAGVRECAAFAACGWRNFAPFFGAGQVRTSGENEFLPILSTNSFLWSYACGGAEAQNIAYLGGTGNFNGGRTTDFREMDAQTVFAMLFGSHLGDWDTEDNLMRAILATPTYGLACVYGGAPHWFLHHMALGETIGYGTRLTQNNEPGGIYSNAYNQAAGQVHVALMGDPTLRLQPVAPPSEFTALSSSGAVYLSWTPSPEHIVGYHIYHAAAATGPFTRLTDSPVTGTNYVDLASESTFYMLRAVKLETSASGTYLNPSQGIFAVAAPTPATNLDSDSDGMLDSDELVAGTDPEDPDSVLKILSAIPVSDGTLTLTWTSVAGKIYSVASQTAGIDEPWIESTDEIPAEETVTSWSIPVSEGTRFFRIRVKQP